MKILNFLRGKYWLIFILLFLGPLFYFFQPVRVKGLSMEPQIDEGENILVEKSFLVTEDIKRGDVVIFRFPLNPEKIFIKRVIGLPGDVVVIKRGKVFVNGKKIDEPYLRGGLKDFSSFPPIKVLPDTFFVLGDNRSISNDSRDWGLLPKRFVIGKALFSYWPPEKIGKIK